MDDYIRVVKTALNLPSFDGHAAQQLMTPAPRSRRPTTRKGKQPRIGAALLLLFVCDDKPCLLLTRRQDNLDVHAGQISFPGGRHEAGEALVDTALRETHEEVGVAPEKLRVLGELTPLYIPPSDFEVYPFVAWHDGGRPAAVPNPREVAEVFTAPLEHFLKPATRQEETWLLRGHPVRVPLYQVGRHKIWGATAMILSEFLERLRQARG